jgi:hypothetical protein
MRRWHALVLHICQRHLIPEYRSQDRLIFTPTSRAVPQSLKVKCVWLNHDRSLSAGTMGAMVGSFRLSAIYYATNAKGPVLLLNQSVHSVVPSSLAQLLETRTSHRENVKAEESCLIEFNYQSRTKAWEWQVLWNLLYHNGVHADAIRSMISVLYLSGYIDIMWRKRKDPPCHPSDSVLVFSLLLLSLPLTFGACHSLTWASMIVSV